MAKNANIGKAIADGFSYFFKEWKLLVGINALFLAPLFAILYWVSAEAMKITDTMTTSFPIESIIIFIVIAVVVSIILQISMVFITLMAWKKKKSITFSDVMAEVKKKFLPVLGTGLLLMIIILAIIAVFALLFIIVNALLPSEAAIVIASVIIALAAFIIMVWVGLRIMFAQYYVIAKDIYYTKAIKASDALVKGKWWYIFWRVLLIQIIAFGLSAIIGMIIAAITLAIRGIGAEPSILAQLIDMFIRQLVVLPMGMAMAIFFFQLSHGKKNN